MKKRKFKVFSILLLITLVLSGCGTVSDSQTGSDINGVPTSATGEKKPLVIAASFYPMYIFTLNIANEISDVQVINLTQPTTGCLHDYALTAEDMKKVTKADILVINGAGIESFIDKVINQKPDLKIIDASQGIPLLKGTGEEGYNPHVWVSISNAILQVKNIGRELAVLNPENAAQYQANTARYVQELQKQKEKMHTQLEGIQNRNIITFHEAFPYFAEEFNLNIAGVIEREPGSEPSAKELEETVAVIRKLHIKAIFAEPQYPAKAAQTIADETGAEVFYLDPVVSGPMEATAYTDIMERNLATLQGALK